MNGKTEGIILGLHKKSDSKSLVEVYTRTDGRKTFSVFGSRWKSVLMPLSYVELTYTMNSALPFAAINSAQRIYVPTREDVPHYCMAMFMAEVLEKSLRHPMQDESLFVWLTDCLQRLDQTDDLSAWPAYFLAQLSAQLGYGGEMLEEWQNLKSYEVIRQIIQE